MISREGVVPAEAPPYGLTQTEVEASRREHGNNALTPPERDPWYVLFLEKFEDPVIRILIIAAILSLTTSVLAHANYFESVGIILAILLATTIAFANEYHANKQFDILNQVNDEIPVKVIRGGEYTTVSKKDIVVGDLVILEQGDEVPADGRMIRAIAFQVDESRLTGESAPVTKSTSSDPKGEETAYPPNEALRGTLVADGHGLMQVTAVGNATEMGKTAKASSEEADVETPLNRQLERLSRWIGVVGFAIASLTFIALLIRGIATGQLVMNPQQWYCMAVVLVATIVGLTKLWLPIVYDAFELSGHEMESPAWLEEEGLAGWAKTLGTGLLVGGCALLLGNVANLVPSAPVPWFPSAAGLTVLNYFMIAVTIIVVAVPEGLAMSVTLSLAYSMRKMAAANVLVRSLHACETIGATTVICSDKTGTLTQNTMRVKACHFPHADGGAASKVHPALAECIAVNSTANLAARDAQMVGNPTESALLRWMKEEGVHYLEIRHGFRIDEQVPFSTERKYMATAGVSTSGARVEYIKGAPEVLLEKCVSAHGETVGVAALDVDAITAQLRDCQQRGWRTLGFACRAWDGGAAGLESPGAEFAWLGFIALEDPIRPEVPAAVSGCRQAGIDVKIVTGDSPDTAREIARQTGVLVDENVADALLLGREFMALDDTQAREAASRLKVLARARPLEKLRLVKLLQENGDNVVSVTGDGTNDAPALNHADVGLAMGRSGTAVAKEASDIILLDDSFSSIRKSVMWGRSLYQNIQRFILYQLTINVAALTIALLGPFIGIELPFTVTQMLWINLMMDTFAAIALATEPPHENVMDCPPRKPDDFIISPPMAKNILGVSLLFVIVLVGYLLKIKYAGPMSETETLHQLTIFYTVFVMLQFWNLFNARCLGLNQSALRGLSQNPLFLLIALVILVGQIVSVQFLGHVFRTSPLSMTEWLAIIAGTSVVLWLGELWRWSRRLMRR